MANVRLAKLVLRSMVARGSGKVLVTSSIASTMPGTFQSVYNASKSFLQSFAEALQEELKDSGVTITLLMPGPTDTNFFARAKMLATNVGSGKKDDPVVVAKQGLQALRDGKAKVVAGFRGHQAAGGDRRGPARRGQGQAPPQDGRAGRQGPGRGAGRAAVQRRVSRPRGPHVPGAPAGLSARSATS